MVKIEEHKEKMKDIQNQINNCKNPVRKKQLIKCLHRLKKQLSECNMYLKELK